MSESITRHAQDDKAGMTLAELKKTVAQAESIELSEDSKVKAVVGWGGQVKTLTVTTPSTVS